MSKNTKTISWGKPGIYYRKVTDVEFKKCPDIIEDSTQLSTTLGDKLEAKIEGGEAEAVKYKAANYELQYGIRDAAETTQPIPSVNGVVNDEYVVVVAPENAAAPGIVIERSSVTVEEAYTASEGHHFTYTHAALAAAAGSMVKHGIIVVSAGSETGKYSITAKKFDYAAAGESLDGDDDDETLDGDGNSDGETVITDPPADGDGNGQS